MPTKLNTGRVRGVGLVCLLSAAAVLALTGCAIAPGPMGEVAETTPRVVELGPATQAGGVPYNDEIGGAALTSAGADDVFLGPPTRVFGPFDAAQSEADLATRPGPYAAGLRG